MNKEVYIVGGGTSLKGFNFNKLKDKTTIAVNKSCLTVPNLDYFVTMDFTALKKIGMELVAPYIGTRVFIANFAKPYLKEINGQIIDTRFNLVYTLNGFTMIIKSWAEEGIGFNFWDFRSGNNSGYCALQFAFLMGFNPIYLLGIDLAISGEDTHFHQGYGQDAKKFKKKLEEYYKHFVIGLNELKTKKPEIKVISCSQISKLNEIIPYEEFK